MKKKFSDHIKKVKLDCGLNVVTYNIKGFHRFSIDLLVHFGAMYEKYKIDDKIYTLKTGISHFLEHKMFDLPDGDMTIEFDKYGLDNNAYTSFDMTDYYCGGIDNFYEGLKLLLKMVFTPYFEEESIENEKKIITNEILMYEDDPDYALDEALNNNLFMNSPFRHDVGGSAEDVNSITKDDLLSTYNTFYHPKNMDLVIVGDIDFEEIISFLNKELEKYIFNEYQNPVLYLDEEPTNVNKKYSTFEGDTFSPKVEYGIKLNLGDFKYLEATKCLSFILNEMIGFDTKWVQKLLTKRLINSGVDYGVAGFMHYPHIYISVACPNVVVFNKKLKRRIRSFKWYNIHKKALERYKKMSIGSFMSNDSISFYANNLIKSIKYNIEFDDIIMVNKKINVKLVRSYLKKLKRSDVTCVVMMPQQTKK